MDILGSSSTSWLVSIALLMQLYTLVRVSKRVNCYAFYILAVSLYMMGYNYYYLDYTFSPRVIHKIINGTIALLIGVSVSNVV